MSVKLVTVSGPAAAPISLSEAKLHLRVDDSDNDAAIADYLAAATTMAEDFLGRAIVTRQYELRLDAFPRVIRLPRAPVRKIVGVTYVDSAGAERTLDSALYDLDDGLTPPELVPAPDQCWPGTRLQRDAVAVRYIAGYVTPFTAVAATDLLSAPGHPFADGSRVRLLLSHGAGGALPTGLALNTDYFVRDLSGDSFKLAATSGGAAIDITAAGTGSFFIADAKWDMPAVLRSAIKLLLGDLYENREDIVSGVSTARLPFTAETLMWSHRIESFG